MADKKEPFEYGDELFAAIKPLQEKIAALDPNLVVALSFGPRDKAPQKLEDEKLGNAPTAASAESFRNIFYNSGGGFANQFSKTGDGFINVHTLPQ